MHRKLGGYDESLFLVEDYDFWLRAYRNSRFIHLKEGRISTECTAKPYKHPAKEIRERACYLMKGGFVQILANIQTNHGIRRSCLQYNSVSFGKIGRHISKGRKPNR